MKFGFAPEIVTLIAGTGGISGFRAIIIINGKAEYFDNLDPDHYGRCFGISKTSAAEDDLVEVITFGGFETGIALDENIMYFTSNNGTLVNNPPVTGLLQPVGFAMTGSKFFVSIKQSIQLI